jgi:ComEC/Rec2-related protein
LEKSFQRSGVTHVLAISGQHVVILAAVIYFALRLFAIPPTIRAGVTMGLIWLYILIAGAPPSAIRAGVVATFVLAAPLLGRQVSALHFMTTMLALVLAYNPQLIYSTGFQLSVAAVFGILLLTKPLKSLVERTLLRPFARPPEHVSNLISVSLAAQIATSPIVAATFEQVSVVGVLTNLIAVPLSGPILILGLLGSLAGNIYPLLAYPLNACNGFLVAILIQSAQGASSLPLTFVIVGGGPTGVEAAADTHDLIFDVLEDDYPNVDFGSVRVVLLNAGDNILKGLDAPLVHAATRRLASQRIEVINDAKVEEVRPDAVVISDGRTIPTRTTIWAAGIEPPPLVGNLDVQKDHRGRILIDQYLRVKGRPGVYAVGDCTSLQYDGSPVPALAQAAEQEGQRAASNLAAEIENKAPVPFRYRSVGQLVDLGEGSALVDILGVNLSGQLGAYVWKVVYLYELGYDLNRAHVLADWTIDLFTRPDTSKLFEDPNQPRVRT